MSGGVKKSRRGVYYDLTKSPYAYKSPYGDSFKFPSAKKMDIYTRDLPKEIERFEKLLDRHNLKERIPPEIINFLKREISQAFYNYIVR